MELKKKRKPIVSGLASLLAVGLGQLYNGKFIQGILLNIFVLGGFTFSFVVVPSITHKPLSVMFSLIIGLLLVGVIQGYSVVEAYKDSKSKPEYVLKSYNKWYMYGLYAILSMVIIGVLREAMPLKTYKIPAKSMEPTLIVGDHFYVDKAAYNKNNPKRGDIIVFEFPEDKAKDFIKRVVAIPDDNVEIINKNLVVNGEVQKEGYVQYVDSESLKQRDNMSKIIVPANKYFVMGDNRDRSYDSRFWGSIEKEKIKGKALFIYYSKQLSRALTEIK